MFILIVGEKRQDLGLKRQGRRAERRAKQAEKRERKPKIKVKDLIDDYLFESDRLKIMAEEYLKNN